MRPLRLEIKNLTSLRNPEPIDFTGLDLFAIWGPTGAGKSSIVDAITFALFGQVPRVGRGVKELISQNEARMSVSFEFSSGSCRYRVHRSTSNRGVSPVQLDRLRSGGTEWEAVADRAADVTAEIEKVLRMDYGAFIRSVLLPQGEFDRFLSGDRDERRRIVDGLLQLGIYAEMHRRANAIDSQHTGDADRIKQRLESELADATPDALKAANGTLKELESRAKALQSQREAATAAETAARRLCEANDRKTSAQKALAEAQKQLASATKVLAGGEGAIKELDTRIAALEVKAKAANYDPGAHMRLNQCLPLLQDLDSLAKKEQRLAADLAGFAPSLEKLRKDIQDAGTKHEAAKADAQAKRDAFAEAQRNNAAAVLVQDLKPGSPCPICGQTVREVKHTVRKDFAQLKKASEDAQSAEAKAKDAVTAAERQAALKVQDASNSERQLADLRKDIEKRRADAERMLPEPDLSTQDVEARINTFAAAKERLDKLGADERALRDERQRASTELASAQTNVARFQEQARAHEAGISEAAAAALAASAAIAEAAKALVWDDVILALDSGRDAASIIQRHVRDLQEGEADTQREIGGQKTRIEAIERDIDLAKNLRGQEKQHRETATVAKDLASLLRTNNFPTFIREQALRALAEDGTRRLNEISKGRFDFEVDGQDFYVLDRWNGGERRSVKTLSGGETFLASLALALALAEQLPGLSGDTTGGALESLFIDEGFSHLDNETLDDVASALEVLGQDRNRLVGVVTHLPALAERMPARITVHKSQAGSTVTID